MADLFYLSLALLFFVTSAGFVLGVRRLMEA
jgi:hypothetical protein